MRRTVMAGDWERRPTYWLVVAGVALELALLAGFLRPLAMWRHPEAISGYQPLASAFGVSRAGAMQFLLAVVVASAGLTAAVWAGRNARGRSARWLVLAGTAVFALTLLPTNPAGAQDLYHNVADARTLWIYGNNPATTAPSVHADDPFYRHVSAWSDHPSAYGPLWYVIAGAPLPITGDAFWPNVLGQKALAAVFLVALTWLCMKTAEQLRPDSGVAAGILVGWNPLMLFETAGNGHNDIVMMTFAVAALWAVARRSWLWVFPLLALAIATKHVTVILGPVLLLWMLRRPGLPRRTTLLSLALGVGLASLLYLPFLAGGEVLRVVQTDSGRMTSSPGTALVGYLMNGVGFSKPLALMLMKVLFLGGFAYGYFRLLLQAHAGDDVSALMERCFWSLLLFLVLVKWWFWPWYLIWIVPVGALLPRGRIALVAGVFSTTGLLMYVTYYWQIDATWYQRQMTTALAGFAIPVATAIVADVRRSRRGKSATPAVAALRDAA